MSLGCPSKRLSCPTDGRIVRFGRYYRTSDRKWIQRYKCTSCGMQFSWATFSRSLNQKKRQVNYDVMKLLASGVSQRRIAMLLNIHRITVARKLTFLGMQARLYNHRQRMFLTGFTEIQFDDLETFEHTKLKPLSVTLAVDKPTRHILGLEVSKMPAKGLLSKKSLKKYGIRKDDRASSRQRLFRRIVKQIDEFAVIESDDNPHYPHDVKTFFPKATHLTSKGGRGAISGQGELKKLRYDPLFSLNHTCAMLRANVNRLFRKTWCTTKKIQPLIDHLEIYVMFHNKVLIQKAKSRSLAV